jgi:hypothetical protein
MSFIDAAIPAAFGLLLVIWPRLVFFGSRVIPDESKIRLVRRLGGVLLFIAGVFLVISLVEG